MVIVNATLDELMALIGPVKTRFEGLYTVGNFRSDSKELARYEQVKDDFRAVIGLDYKVHDFDYLIRIHPFEEAVFNAIQHGNGQDPDKTLHVNVFRGESGWLAVVTNEGQGFDYDLVQRTGRFTNFGGGFKWFAEPDVNVAFANNGRTVYIQADLPEHLDSIQKNKKK